MSPKLQNLLHWVFVVALTLAAVEPAIKQIIPNGADAILAVILGVATKFVYYADSTTGTTQP